jgi:hypothetical protein
MVGGMPEENQTVTSREYGYAEENTTATNCNGLG